MPRQLAREEESELWEEMKEAGVGGIFEKSGEEVAKITLYRLFLNSFSFKRKCRSDSFFVALCFLFKAGGFDRHHRGSGREHR